MISPDFLNFILLNRCNALYPTNVIRCLFWMAGMQCNVFSPSLILNMQSPLTMVSCGKFSTLPMSWTVLVSSLKRKLISFYLVMRFSTSLIRYSQKYTISPSMRLMGLLSIIRSSPKLYFTWTLQAAPSCHTSQLSTQLSSKTSADRQFYFQSSTASQLTPYVLERDATKSEGNFRPISTRSLDCRVGKFLTGADKLWPRRKRCLVGRVEYMLEWLKEISMGSLVVRSQSNPQVKGMRMIGFDLATDSRISTQSNIRNNIIIIIDQRVIVRDNFLKDQRLALFCINCSLGSRNARKTVVNAVRKRVQLQRNKGYIELLSFGEGKKRTQVQERADLLQNN